MCNEVRKFSTFYISNVNHIFKYGTMYLILVTKIHQKQHKIFSEKSNLLKKYGYIITNEIKLNFSRVLLINILLRKTKTVVILK